MAFPRFRCNQQKWLLNKSLKTNFKAFSSKRGLLFHNERALQGGEVSGFLLKIPGEGSLGEGGELGWEGPGGCLRGIGGRGAKYSFRIEPKRDSRGPFTVRKTQRALRDTLMSCGKNWLPTVSRQFLTRNYPRPNGLLKSLQNCLPPPGESIFPLSKLPPQWG